MDQILSPTEQLNEQNIRLEPGWKAVLKDEFGKEYFQSLRKFLKEEKRQGQLIYPPGPQIFAAFNKTPFDRVKVVIIGQDPYHGEGQANGLCFSVSEGLSKPPSLVNIFKEMQADLGFPIPKHGSLEAWAAQGVLLLNATLTVRAGQAGSHQGKGWEEFTDAVIRTINEQCSGVVFLLWGNYAKGKGALIDRTRHFVLEAAHPSPLARTGFLGCRHFSKTNEILKSEGRTPVDWRLES